jgi:hypothetical protein
MKTSNTPILFIIFNRPKNTKKVFQAIKEAKPRKLFISADGPRKNIPQEIELTQKAREIVNQIDWPCKVKTKFSPRNLGCKKAVTSAINWFFKHVDAGIILEDDCLPNQSFFNYCQELLKKYAHDERIMQISGNNYLLGRKVTSTSYYFSKLNDIWGWATWKRAWELYDPKMKTFSQFKKQRQLNNYLVNSQIKRWLMAYFNDAYRLVDSHRGIWSTAWSYAICVHNGLVIVPRVNLVANIGIGSQATHSSNSFQPYAEIRTKPLKKIIHPKFILPNQAADNLRFELIRQTDPHCKMSYRLRKFLYQSARKFLGRYS